MNGCRRTVSIVRHTEGVNITALLPLVLLAAEEEVGGVQRFLTRPVIAIAIVVGCFVLTRITYAILRIVVRKVADSKPGRGKGWWKNTMRRVGAETLESGENRRRQRIEAATGMLHQLTSFVLWIIAAIAVFSVLGLVRGAVAAESRVALVIGNAGYPSGDLSNLFEEASQKWILGPSINVPLFAGGKSRGRGWWGHPRLRFLVLGGEPVDATIEQLQRQFPARPVRCAGQPAGRCGSR